MYKVFINDKPIILTDLPQNGEVFRVYDYEKVVKDELFHKLKKNIIDGVILFCQDLEKSWNDFKSNFEIVKAAGGLVINDKNEFLFIYRNNRWDLPKGKIEKDEAIKSAAVREVNEECGICELTLKRRLATTYHIFTLHHQDILKQTYWFAMQTSFTGKLTPQREEGITIAEFKDTLETQSALKNTHANIHLVFESYYNLR